MRRGLLLVSLALLGTVGTFLGVLQHARSRAAAEWRTALQAWNTAEVGAGGAFRSTTRSTVTRHALLWSRSSRTMRWDLSRWLAEEPDAAGSAPRSIRMHSPNVSIEVDGVSLTADEVRVTLEQERVWLQHETRATVEVLEGDADRALASEALEALRASGVEVERVGW